MVVANFTRVTNSLLNEGVMRNAMESALSGGGGGGGDGVQGPTGPAGSAGSNGLQGSQGFTGPEGTFGSSETIAIGYLAGSSSQGAQGIAIGANAGESNQGGGAVAIGSGAGGSGQLENAIAIGKLAGATDQAEGSIALNASGSELNPTASGFFVDPVRKDFTKMFISPLPMAYDENTKEVYCTPISASEFTPTVFPFNVSGSVDGLLFGQVFGSMKYVFGKLTQTTASGGTPSPLIKCSVQVYMPPDFYVEIASVNLAVAGVTGTTTNDMTVSMIQPPTKITQGDSEVFYIWYEVLVRSGIAPTRPGGYTSTVFISVIGF